MTRLSTPAPGLSELSRQEQGPLIARLRRSLESLSEGVASQLTDPTAADSYERIVGSGNFVAVCRFWARASAVGLREPSAPRGRGEPRLAAQPVLPLQLPRLAQGVQPSEETRERRVVDSSSGVDVDADRESVRVADQGSGVRSSHIIRSASQRRPSLPVPGAAEAVRRLAAQVVPRRMSQDSPAAASS